MQASAWSQTPADARHSWVEGAKPSAGHVLLEPVHDSATSQTPADARHITVEDANASTGHALLLPVQDSETSQRPTEGRHITVAAANPSAGHSKRVPSHVSATSQAPFTARHVAPAALGEHWPAPLQSPLPQASSEHSASGSLAAVTGAQVPLALPVFAAEHAWHRPSQADSQQTPSTQLPDLHALPSLHANPFSMGGGAQANQRATTTQSKRRMR